MLLDKGERRSSISAKMPIAFLGRRAPCASDRVHAADGRSRRLGRRGTPPGAQARLPGDPAARGGGEPPISAERHCLSIEGWIPSSAAICICGRPLLSGRATASRLNSGVNSPRLGHQTPSPPARSVSEVSVKAGDDQWQAIQSAQAPLSLDRRTTGQTDFDRLPHPAAALNPGRTPLTQAHVAVQAIQAASV